MARHDSIIRKCFAVSKRAVQTTLKHRIQSCCWPSGEKPNDELLPRYPPPYLEGTNRHAACSTWRDPNPWWCFTQVLTLKLLVKLSLARPSAQGPRHVHANPATYVAGYVEILDKPDNLSLMYTFPEDFQSSLPHHRACSFFNSKLHIPKLHDGFCPLLPCHHLVPCPFRLPYKGFQTSSLDLHEKCPQHLHFILKTR